MHSSALDYSQIVHVKPTGEVVLVWWVVPEIFMPNANNPISASGNNTYDFVGAGVAKTINMRGNFQFHYDEALGKTGPNRGFVLTSWNEMTPTEVATIPGN